MEEHLFLYLPGHYWKSNRFSSGFGQCVLLLIYGVAICIWAIWLEKNFQYLTCAHTDPGLHFSLCRQQRCWYFLLRFIIKYLQWLPFPQWGTFLCHARQTGLQLLRGTTGRKIPGTGVFIFIECAAFNLGVAIGSYAGGGLVVDSTPGITGYTLDRCIDRIITGRITRWSSYRKNKQ